MARYYDAEYGRFLAVDPLGGNHLNFTPFVYCGDNPVKYIDPFGRDWVDGNGKPISPKALEKVKIYIFHDDEFPKQARIQYNAAVAKFGHDAVALSNTGTTSGFAKDWEDMQGNIMAVMIVTHGKNQSIKVADGQQFTATGDGRTNIAGTKAPNIQDLPQPKGDIQNAILFMFTCHSADAQKMAHGEGDHAQGDLKGSGKPIAQVFSETFRFKAVVGTEDAVNYHSWRDFTFPWSSSYMKPYPENGKWLFYTPTAQSIKTPDEK